MNWFQRLWATPKFHAAVSVIAGIAGAVFPQYALIAATVSGMAGTNAAVLPHPAVPLIPPAGSLHGDDYARLAQTVVDAVKSVQSPAPRQ